MEQEQNQQQARKENGTLATADLAGAESRDEAWRKSENGDDGDSRGNQDERAALLSQADCSHMREEWDSIQAAFVDEPRNAVERADNLVARTMKQLAETFASERSRLEGTWDRGGDVSTEDLRIALQRYRTFFNRLLTI
jgi:hypothetical protein